jgi:hypothetical protein
VTGCPIPQHGTLSLSISSHQALKQTPIIQTADERARNGDIDERDQLHDHDQTPIQSNDLDEPTLYDVVLSE